MKFELDVFNRNSTDDDLIKDLKRVATELNSNKVTIDQYNERGMYHSTTLTRRFGSWFKVLDNAGLQKTRNLHLTNDELFENIEHAWQTLGRQPRYTDMVKPVSKFSAGTYEKRFGTWRKSLEAFINFINENSTGDLTEEPPILNNKSQSSIHKTKRTVNWRLRFLVLRRDNFACVACGKSPSKEPNVDLQVDHIVPWDSGGETVYENLQTLCMQCNIGKSNLSFKENQ